jgi:ABC-type Fe3+-siderophore transport system permease subunit
MTIVEAFLLGFISAASFVAGLFFLKFWRDTRDPFFLPFAASFLLEAITRALTMFLAHPNEGHPAIYLLRLAAFLLILAAIARKNFSAKRPKKRG